MKLLLMDPNNPGEPITVQGKVGDPILPVLENARGDRVFRLVVGTANGQDSYNMQEDPFQPRGVDDIEGAYPATGSGEQEPSGPIIIGAPGVATFTVLGVRGRIKTGVLQSPKILDTIALEFVA